MINALTYFFIFFAGFMSLTIALGLLLEDEKKTYHNLFASMMFSLGALQILNGLLVEGKLNEYPGLIFWYLPFLALCGPLFFLAFKSVNDDSFHLKPIHYLHFSSLMLILPLMIPLVILDAPTKISFIMQAPDLFAEIPMFRLYSILFAVAVINLTGYIIYFVRECLFMLNFKLIKEKQVSPYLIIVVLVSFPLAIVFLLCITAMSTLEHLRLLFLPMIKSLTAVSFVVPLVIFIMEKKDINFFKSLNIEIENRHREISKMKNLDVADIVARIKTLMEDDKIFRNEDLSVNSLARELGIEPYQLSIIINANYNKNFKNLINEYRIKEAKKILLADIDRTITSVAYEVGFNSTTVFYEWFKRHTNVSPKIFRDINRNTNGMSIDMIVND